MKQFLKYLSLTIATIGLLISLSDAMGFIPNSRARLADRITSLGNGILPLNNENVDSLLRYFLKNKYPAYQKQANEMAGIAIEDLRMNASVMGTVYLEHKNGGRHQLCSFQELREWANNDKLAFWVGWWVAVAGLVCAWIVELLGVHRLRKSRIAIASESDDANQEVVEAKTECNRQESSNQPIAAPPIRSVSCQMMNDEKMSKADAWSLMFLLRADEFYILTRYCYRAFLQYSSFHLAHHAIEYYLKSGLAHFMAPKQLKRLGHKVEALWKEYKRHTPHVKLDGRVLEHIDHFESMRYPGCAKFVRIAWGQPYEDLFDNVMPNVPERARDTLTCFCMEDIDHIVHVLRSSIPHGDELPIIVVGEDQERYLFHDNKYFTKEDNERQLHRDAK